MTSFCIACSIALVSLWLSSVVASAFTPLSNSITLPRGPLLRQASPSTLSPAREKDLVLRSQRRSESPLGTNVKEEGRERRRPQIVILGGGFGGINTALTLPTFSWPDDSQLIGKPHVTLIDRDERFVFLPLLYELCVEDASLEEVAPTYKSLLADLTTTAGKNDRGLTTSFKKAEVEGIDVENCQVVLSSRNYRSNDAGSGGDIIETIDYDALIIATGSEISLDAIPGASKYALPFYTVDQCLELKRRLAVFDSYLERKQDERLTKQDKDGPVLDVVVLGGGYSGVELALNLVERLGSQNDDVHVTLVHRGSQVLEYATEYNRNAGLDRLKSAGVKVMTSTSVVEIIPSDDLDDTDEGISRQQCLVKLANKNSDNDSATYQRAHLLLWTAGATPTSELNTGIRNSILPRDVMGRIVTSPTLNVPQYPNVFAIGDCSRPKKVPYPATAQVAMQMATVASCNVYETLVGKHNNDARSRGVHKEPKLLPFNYLNLGEMMTLGSNDATISSLGGAFQWSGPAASLLRRWIYAVRMPTLKQGLVAAVDGTERRLARGILGGLNQRGGSESEKKKRKSKPVDWN